MPHDENAAPAPCEEELVYKMLHCTHCNRIHVDQGKYSTFNHRLHVCQFCHRTFHSDEPCIGTASPCGLHTEQEASLNSVLVEP